MNSPKLQYSRRIRKTPYTDRVESLGVSGFSVVNHTILPKGFQHTEQEDYWHLREFVQIWDVGCQRQVSLKGPDAAYLAQLLTPRNLGSAEVGQCLYAPCIDQSAGMLNDPVILMLAEDHFWFSIADSDLLLWAKGIALGMGLTVEIDEPDVWPLAVQGPLSDQLMSEVFGDRIAQLRFFNFDYFDLDGTDFLIARSGFSKQGGFEIYVHNSALCSNVWDQIWSAGGVFNLRPGCPNLIERIEAGLLSYGNEMTRDDNPLHCGLDQFCDVNSDIHYIGREALQSAYSLGPERKITGIVFGEKSSGPCRYPWPVHVDGDAVGYVTSVAWSPRFERNVALAMIGIDYHAENTPVVVEAGTLRLPGVIKPTPMN
ncbi:MAG: dimethylsulfoniopropionate demethylase [Pseudomonadota bacterium]